MAVELHLLPAEDFEALLGQSLPVRGEAQGLALVVDSVWRSPYPTARPIPGFSLFLRGALDTPLGQGIVTLQHPRHGGLDLFMTPVGRDARGYRYEIVFN